MTPQFPRFTTPVIVTIAQFFVQDQKDPMDLSAFKRPRNFFTPEKRKYRFDNNLFFYCDKPKHRVMDYKITIYQINFVISTSLTTVPFAIDFFLQKTQQGKI